METIIDYVHSLEDSKRLLDPLLRVLVQKKTVRAEDAEPAIGSALRKVQETIQAQLMSYVVLEKNPQQGHVACLFTSSGTGMRKMFEADEGRLHNALVSLGRCAAKTALDQNESIVLGEESSRNTCLSEELLECGYNVQSMMAVPVFSADVAIGAAIAINRRERDGRIGFFSDEDLQLLEDVAHYCGKVLGRALHPKEPVAEREMAGWIARYIHCETAPSPLNACEELVTAIGIEKLRHYGIVPLQRISDNQLCVALANPMDLQLITDFETLNGYRVAEKLVSTPSDVRDALKRAVHSHTQVMKEAEKVNQQFDTLDAVNESELAAEGDENSALIIRIINRLIEDAHQNNASDIHIEPTEVSLEVRYRIDGVCRKKLTLPKAAQHAVVARIKIMCDLDIAEHRVPQDGKIVFKKYRPGFDVDLRVSVAPMNHGESVVMRLLDRTRSTLPLDKLGFSKYNLDLYHEAILAPYGMILHCGPTGSGKSMTLYAALNEINTPEWKILTVEDPVEYTLPGINQLQVKPSVGLTFASALRCFLRQDPDIILVGEIRDKETAEIAIEAALTGHLLFSTLHTNDAISTVTRLKEIGIEPCLIASTLIAICSQRLIRRLCTCKQAVVLDADDIRRLEFAHDLTLPSQLYRPTGCDTCDRAGYKGRTGLHELLVLNDEMRDMITNGMRAEALKVTARLNGMRTLFEDAMEKVAIGVSSMAEALSVVREDETSFSALTRANCVHKNPRFQEDEPCSSIVKTYA